MIRPLSVVELALNARTAADAERLEEALRAALPNARDWELDNNRGNWSSVASAADAGVLLCERTVNMFDALIEMLIARMAQPECHWRSPAEAATELFGDRARATVAGDAVVRLLDSDDSARTPTIAFRDRGIGLTPGEMPQTILTLNKSNKIRKLYLHGVFGKGGTTACQHSDATIIVTRKQPDLLEPGEDDRVSVAMITLGDAPDAKVDFFRYLAGVSRNGGPAVFSVPAEEVRFEPGTYVAHINYRANPKLGTQNWNQEESVYFQAETILFKPALPYGLQDARSARYNKRPEDRRKRPETVAGLARRLENVNVGPNYKIRTRSRWTTIDVPGLGEVRLRWWYFKGRDERRQYVAHGHAVIFTSNGQTHHSWDTTRLHTLVPGLRRVAQQLLVEVDCDSLDIRKRTRLFSTDRVQLRHTAEGKALEDQVAATLRDDHDLEDAERDLQSAALKSADSGLTENILQQLNRAINFKVPGISQEPTKPTKPTTPTPVPPPMDLYAEPTTMEGPESIIVVAGGTANLRLTLNAHDGFVPDKGTMTFDAHGVGLHLTTRGDLRKGRMLAGVTADGDLVPGRYSVDLLCTWQRDTGEPGSLAWTTKVEVVRQLKPTGKTQPKTRDRGSLAFVWSSTEEQPEWTADTAGEVMLLDPQVLAKKDPKLYGFLRNVKQKIPTIHLNKQFRDYAAYRDRVRPHLSDIQWDTRHNRYLVAVGSAVANTWAWEQKLSKKDEREDIEPPSAMTAEQQRRATAQAARATLLLLADIDKMQGDKLS